MKVAIYTRVSTDSENQLNSLKNQQDYYTSYCREKGYESFVIYADEGLTGTNMKREDFLRMLHDAGLNTIKDEFGTRFIMSNRIAKFDYIITKDVSRFARNTNVMDVVKLLRKKKVYIYFQNANIDTKDENYQFLLNMFLNFAQQESIDRSQKVIFGLKQRAKNGKYHFGSERLYGYGYDTETKEIYLIEHEVEIVKKVFDLYTVNKIGSMQISDILNKDGIKTLNNKKWTANAIIRMLKNEKYTGNVNLLKYSYGDVTDENRQKKIKDSEEWVYKKDLIPSIITVGTYQLSQEIMQSRTSENRGINTPKNMFSQKIKCAKCGKNYIRSNQKQNDTIYYFYACSNRRRTKECDNHSVTLKRLENEIQPYCDGKLHEILNERKETLIKWLGYNINLLETKIKTANNKKESLRQQIKEIESEINNLITSFLTASETVKKAVNRKIESLETERGNLESEIFNYDEIKITSEITKLIELKNHIQKSSTQTTFTMEEVLSFVHKIVIDGVIIKVDLSFDELLPKSTTVKDVLLGLAGEFHSSIEEFKHLIEQA